MEFKETNNDIFDRTEQCKVCDNEFNLILDSDSYKFSHSEQYPEGTEVVYSYLEARGGKFDKTVFFGLQYLLKRYLSKPITLKDIKEAEEVATLHGIPFNYEGWLHILKEHSGYLPLKIKAVPEGTVMSKHNVLMTIENTDPKCFWLTNYMETLLMRVWYSITVASNSYACKQILKKFIDRTSDVPEQIYFKLHDFGSRGVSSQESAGIGGLAHLVNFKGTDTVISLLYGRRYYDCNIAGFSIPATEHSTMTSWGKENEAKAFKNTLHKYKGKMVSVVSDSYDIYNACENIWGKELKQDVLDHGNFVVIRPDSGDPIKTPVECLELLDKAFGHVENSKGYKVLNNVRVIQGDGIDIKDMEAILILMEEKGYAVDNMAFGMGGGLLQKVNRDTLKFAIKCSAIKVNGEWKEISKSPVRQPDKKSKKGKLLLGMADDEFITIECKNDEDYKLIESVQGDILRTVFLNGILTAIEDLDTIRERADK